MGPLDVTTRADGPVATAFDAAVLEEAEADERGSRPAMAPRDAVAAEDLAVVPREEEAR